MVERPTKKQKELLDFINITIKSSGYAPSYREIMRALEYRSVSTVATHINGLIEKGFLVKKDRSARSLAVVSEQEKTMVKAGASDYLAWLRAEADKACESEVEKSILQKAVAIIAKRQDL